MKSFSILLLAVSLLGVSCERHEFSETKQLHEHHGAGASHDAGGHEGAGHGKGKDAHNAEH